MAKTRKAGNFRTHNPPPPPTHTHTLHNSSKILHHQLYPNLLPSLSLRQKKMYMAKKGKEREKKTERERDREKLTKDRRTKAKHSNFVHLPFFSFRKIKKDFIYCPDDHEKKLPVCKQFLSFQNFFCNYFDISTRITHVIVRKCRKEGAIFYKKEWEVRVETSRQLTKLSG